MLAHRLILDTEAEFAGVTAIDVLARILEQTAPPALRAA